MKSFIQFREEIAQINENRKPIIDYADVGEVEKVEYILRDELTKLVTFEYEWKDPNNKDLGKNAIAEIKKFGLSIKGFSKGGIRVEPNIYERGKKIATFSELGFDRSDSSLSSTRASDMTSLMQHVLVRSALVFAKPLKVKAQKALDKVRADDEKMRRRDAALTRTFKK
jgi:hypothetical protein